MLLSTIANANPNFTLYGFIPWEQHVTEKGENIKDFAETKNYLSKQGIKPIKVIYHRHFLTNDDVPDPVKIKKIADESKFSPEIPISFDIEKGDNFKPNTVLPIAEKTLDLYHKFGGAAPVGVYALLPQNSYGARRLSNEEAKKTYTDLNKKYESIAKKVDFLSPVFYNYDKKDIDLWKKSASFHMAESRKYAKKYNLKIIPYITSTYTQRKEKFYVEQMTEKDMQERLNYLKNAGADGVILWESSEAYEHNGKKPVLDFTHGWAKALKTIQKQ